MNKQTPEEILEHVLSELERVALPDEKTAKDDFWTAVEVRADNATCEICDTDVFIKNLIKYIQAGNDK